MDIFRRVETTACRRAAAVTSHSSATPHITLPDVSGDESRVLPPHWGCLEPGWSPDLRPPGPLWSTGFLHRAAEATTQLSNERRGSGVSLSVQVISQKIITCVSLVVSDEALGQESHHERCKIGRGKQLEDELGRNQVEDCRVTLKMGNYSEAPCVFLPVFPTPLPPITAIFMTRLESELSGAGHSAIVVMLWMRRMVSSQKQSQK